MDYYKSEAEIEAVSARFRILHHGEGRLQTPQPPHRRGVVPQPLHTMRKLLQKIRSGLFRFLDHHGVGREKYNETLTIFWIRLVQKAMEELGKQRHLVETTNSVLERFADPRIVFEYYSEECLKSEMARTGWVEPDLKKL